MFLFFCTRTHTPTYTHTCTRTRTQDNIAVTVLLESIETGLSYLVANAHFHWDPEFCDVKVCVAVGVSIRVRIGA